MTQTPIETLYPVYSQYIHGHVIPLASRHPDLYGAPMSKEDIDATLCTIKRLMDTDPYALDGISAEILGGIAWIANRAITLIQQRGGQFGYIEGDTEQDQLKGILKAVWPVSALLFLEQDYCTVH